MERQRQKLEASYKLKASLGYAVNSRSVRAIVYTLPQNGGKKQSLCRLSLDRVRR